VRTIIDLREEDELSTRAAPPRALVMELAAGLELDRPALRRRLVVE